MKIINRTKGGFIAGDNVAIAPTKKMELLKSRRLASHFIPILRIVGIYLIFCGVGDFFLFSRVN